MRFLPISGINISHAYEIGDELLEPRAKACSKP